MNSMGTKHLVEDIWEDMTKEERLDFINKNINTGFYVVRVELWAVVKNCAWFDLYGADGNPVVLRLDDVYEALYWF